MHHKSSSRWDWLVALSLLAVSVSLFSLTGIAHSQDKKEKKGDGKKDEAAAEEQVFQVDPEGQPKEYDRRPDSPTFYLWRSGDEWHLRSKTKEKSHAFSGTIFVQEGRVTRIYNFEGLEEQKQGKEKGKGKGKKGGSPDIGQLNGARNRISFRFETKGKEDGFDFTISKETVALVFDLKVDGYEHRAPVQIGAGGRSPAQQKFRISIQPQDGGEKSGEEKK